MAYNRNNKLKEFNHILQVYKEVKQDDIPDTFIITKIFPKPYSKSFVYERLKASGAQNVHFSYFDHVVDITNQYGGASYRYNGHWSWVYLHANECRLDYDGKPVKVNGMPVTIMQWLAAQKGK